jgi:hypothetical protein
MAQIDISRLTATELDDLIARAAQRRTGLQPAVPNEPPQEIQAPIDPRWFTFMAGENTVLQFQHMGFGWISFMMPPHERANLLTVLLRQALTPVQAQIADVAATRTGGGTVH